MSILCHTSSNVAASSFRAVGLDATSLDAARRNRERSRKGGAQKDNGTNDRGRNDRQNQRILGTDGAVFAASKSEAAFQNILHGRYPNSILVFNACSMENWV